MPDNKKGKRYDLYLFALNDENIKEAVKYRFNRINSKYILIYTDKLQSTLQESRYHIIDESETFRLSDSEKVWLLEANVKIITEESVRNQEEILKRFGERLDLLEKELQKESAKQAEGKAGQ